MLPNIFYSLLLCALSHSVSTTSSGNPVPTTALQSVVNPVSQRQPRDEWINAFPICGVHRPFTYFESKFYKDYCHSGYRIWERYDQAYSSLKTKEQDKATILRIVDEPEVLEGQRAKDLLCKYGISEQNGSDGWERMLAFIQTCRNALSTSPPSAVDFDLWASGESLGSSRAKSSDLFNYETMKTVKRSPGYMNIMENIFSKSLNDLILPFLDVIIRSRKTNINTIYDPKKEILFIEEQDEYILVTSSEGEDYVIARMDRSAPLDNTNKDFPVSVYFSARFLNRRALGNDALAIFTTAMTRLGYKCHFSLSNVTPARSSSKTTNGIRALFDALTGESQNIMFKPDLMNDIVKAVLIGVYRNNHRPGILDQYLLDSMKNCHFPSSTVGINLADE